MKVKVDPAQTSDDAALAELYGRNHRLAAGRIRPEPDQGAQTFVARVADRVIGMVLMTYMDDGIHRYGILHVLEVDEPSADYAHEVAIELVNMCRCWLRGRGIDQLLAAPQLDAPTIVDDLRRLRAVQDEQFRSGPRPVQAARYVTN